MCVCVCVCVCVWFYFLALLCLVPQPGIEPVTLAAEAQSLNHWTTKEVPPEIYFQWWKSINVTSHGVSLWTHLLPLVRSCFHLLILLSFPLSELSSSALPSLWDTQQSSECTFSTLCSIPPILTHHLCKDLYPKKVTFWVTEIRRWTYDSGADTTQAITVHTWSNLDPWNDHLC